MKTTLHTDWTVGDICKGFVFVRFGEIQCNVFSCQVDGLGAAVH